ncbi:hypothetical protein RvY_17262 [Ramazzottius varieornatus]|uniref:Uncharacterized protein n=1 Tax=Ramazzottius varieornatus TaxID=947166 RepID=A0A1D1W1K2_RAMVA|nr:hypothetical protein RvY_17262 [Ramazzottius varieornatus]
MGKTLNYTALALLAPLWIPLCLVLCALILILLFLLIVLYPVALLCRKTYAWLSSCCKSKTVRPSRESNGSSSDYPQSIVKNSEQSAAVYIACQLPSYAEAGTTRVIVLPPYKEVVREEDGQKKNMEKILENTTEMSVNDFSCTIREENSGTRIGPNEPRC